MPAFANPPRVYATFVVNTSGPPDRVASMIMQKPIYPVAVHAVAFSPDGKTLATGDGTGQLRLWNPGTGKLLRELRAHSNWVFSISWTKDSRGLITGGGDNLIQWFDAGNPTTSSRTILAHSNDVHAVALTRDAHTLFSAGDDRQIVIWDVKRGEPRRRISGHERQIPTLVLSPDEKWIASGSRDHSVRIWDARTGSARDTLIGHTSDIVALAFSPDGSTLASAGWDYTVRLWDARNGKAIRVLLGHPNWVSGVAFSPDGEQLVSSSGGQLRTVEPGGGKEVWTTTFQGVIKGGGGEAAEDLSTVVYSPDGKTIAVGSTIGSTYLVSRTTGEVIHELRPPK
ncbi:MAG TPA: WD40 repeat domain-containing protein [Verrucomicrobiae bacterium]|nr:WD40 repeat domain-containing protein [Verrucomicrobiae bacterium]